MFLTYLAFSHLHFTIDILLEVYMTYSNYQHAHQTQTARVQHEQQDCKTSETQVTRVRLEYYPNDTSATRVLHERHECHTIQTF